MDNMNAFVPLVLKNSNQSVEGISSKSFSIISIPMLSQINCISAFTLTSDGISYPNECKLRRESCEQKKSIEISFTEGLCSKFIAILYFWNYVYFICFFYVTLILYEITITLSLSITY